MSTVYVTVVTNSSHNSHFKNTLLSYIHYGARISIYFGALALLNGISYMIGSLMEVK